MADIKPSQPVRRFDVFAEYQRLKARNKDHLPEDEAKGYGIWLAKVVAARRFRKSSTGDAKEPGERRDKDSEELVDNKWRSLDGTPQTDELFEKEVVRRMGEDFYRQVFSPAIQKAFETGQDYMDIRDSIRKGWSGKASK